MRLRDFLLYDQNFLRFGVETFFIGYFVCSFFFVLVGFGVVRWFCRMAVREGVCILRLQSGFFYEVIIERRGTGTERWVFVQLEYYQFSFLVGSSFQVAVIVLVIVVVFRVFFLDFCGWLNGLQLLFSFFAYFYFCFRILLVCVEIV